MATQTQHVSHAPPRGVKRAHDDDLDNAQRLAKRFHLLNLENQHNGKLWIPPQTGSSSSHQHNDAPPAIIVRPPTEDFMNIDDTKDRIYIHDLDAELASASDTDDEERIIFLPDIEKKLNGVPPSVLAGDRAEKATDQQMVLYSVPHSISVPEEQDTVRKAIIESRARARDQQIRGDVDPTPSSTQSMAEQKREDPVFSQATSNLEQDSNAMDLD